MTEYITTADVDALLGAGWEGTGDAARAVLESNAWLTSRGVIASDPVEDAIKQAGAYLAERAAAGNLYADTSGNIKSKSVQAGSVSTSTEYMDGSTSSAGIMRLVLDLLRPYLPAGGGSTFTVSRA